jgi:hypothetical protein
MYVISVGRARESTRCRRREALADTLIICLPIGERYGSFSLAISMPSASSLKVGGRIGSPLGDEKRQFLHGARPGRSTAVLRSRRVSERLNAMARHHTRDDRRIT